MYHLLMPSPPTKVILSKAAMPSESSTPFLSFSRISSLISPKTRTEYSLSITCEGCIRRFASSPSLVKRMRPVVLMSSLPTDTQRLSGMMGSASNTDGLPSGSLLEQISPSGLL